VVFSLSFFLFLLLSLSLSLVFSSFSIWIDIFFDIF
jgi:hypothetical protein